MSKFCVILICLFIVFVDSSYSFGIDFNSILGQDKQPIKQHEDRLLLVGATGNVPFNASQLATIIGLLATAFLPLLLLTGLCLLAVGHLYYSDRGGNGHSGGGGGYGHSSYSSRAFDEIDWEKLSILDWISIADETWRKFDPTDLHCQQKFICEIHKNYQKLGSLANSFVDCFEYLKYLDLFSVPDVVKILSQDYLEAAKLGRSSTVDCDDTFPDCEFSVMNLYNKYR